MTGKFLVVEGLEGSGKSTAIDLIKHWLNDRGIKQIITTREPGGTPIAEELRSIIKRKYYDDNMDAITELLLMYAARVQLVNRVIVPALQRGVWVIGDRHELSTLAYQGGGRGINHDTIKTLSQLSLHGFKPHLTIYLDLEPEIGLRRVTARGAKDRIEEESLDFFKRVRKVYCDYANNQADVYTVNGNQDLAKVHADIIAILAQYCDIDHE